MRRRHVSLSPVIDRAIEAQVKLGRYKDFSAAFRTRFGIILLDRPRRLKNTACRRRKWRAPTKKSWPESNANAAPENSGPGVRDSHPAFVSAGVQTAFADTANRRERRDRQIAGHFRAAPFAFRCRHPAVRGILRMSCWARFAHAVCFRRWQFYPRDRR